MTINKTEIIHATCLSIGCTGVLLRAPSGGGKSDLALRMLDQPGRGLGHEFMQTTLIADDRVSIWRNENSLMASCPKTLTGLLEVRGLGVVQVVSASTAPIGLVVDLVARAKIERMPDLSENIFSLWGIAVPKIAIAPFEVSAPAKIRAAVCALGQGILSEGMAANSDL